MNQRLEDEIRYAAFSLFERIEADQEPDAILREGKDLPPRKIWVSESIKRFRNWKLKLTMQRQLSPTLNKTRKISNTPHWMTVLNDDGLWLGIALTQKHLRASYIMHVPPHLWMDMVRVSVRNNRHHDITNELSEPSTLFLQRCIAESNEMLNQSPIPSRQFGGYDWFYFDENELRQNPLWDTHARDFLWLQTGVPSFFLNKRFGVCVWGHFTPHLLIRRNQTIFLWKIPTEFRPKMINNAKSSNVFLPTRVLPKLAEKDNKILPYVDI